MGITWTLDGDLTRLQKIDKLKKIIETIRQEYSGNVHVGLNDWKDTDADRVVRMLGEYILLLEGSKVDPNKVTDTAMDKVNTIGIIGSIFHEGEVAKYAYVGQAMATPSDVGGVDEILGMAVTIIPNTAAARVTDELTVTDNGDGTFTVAKTV